MAIFYRIESEYDEELRRVARLVGDNDIFHVFAGTGDSCRLRHVPDSNDYVSEEFTETGFCDEECDSDCRRRQRSGRSKTVAGKGTNEQYPNWIVLTSTHFEQVRWYIEQFRSYFVIVLSPKWKGDDTILPCDLVLLGIQDIISEAKDIVTRKYLQGASHSELRKSCEEKICEGFDREIEKARVNGTEILAAFLSEWRDCVRCFGA